jgi:hypothetical protein
MIDKVNLMHNVPVGLFRCILNLWPPLWGAGIHITKMSKDFRLIQVRLKLHWYNRNMVGTQFGGSLYAMTDPFFMLMTIANLGDNYIVWDKAAKIDFIKPGRGTVFANFEMTAADFQEIKLQADTNEKYLFDRQIDVVDETGLVIATVIKTVYVRKKTPPIVATTPVIPAQAGTP